VTELVGDYGYCYNYNKLSIIIIMSPNLFYLFILMYRPKLKIAYFVVYLNGETSIVLFKKRQYWQQYLKNHDLFSITKIDLNIKKILIDYPFSFIKTNRYFYTDQLSYNTIIEAYKGNLSLNGVKCLLRFGEDYFNI